MKRLLLVLSPLLFLFACQPKATIDLQFNLSQPFQKKGAFRMVNITDNPPTYMRSELDIDFDLNYMGMEDNSHSWQIVFRHVRMVQGQPYGQDIYFDSNPNGENSELNEYIAGTYNSMLNIPIPIKTDGYGAMTEAIEFDSIFGGAATLVQNNSNFSQVIKYLFLPYPKHMVGNGTTWDSTYVLTYSAAMNMNDQYTFVDESDDYGIHINTEIAPNFDHEKSFDDIESGQGTQEVKMKLNRTTNLLTDLSLQQELTMHFFSDRPEIGEKKDFNVTFKTGITMAIR